MADDHVVEEKVSERRRLACPPTRPAPRCRAVQGKGSRCLRLPSISVWPRTHTETAAPTRSYQAFVDVTSRVRPKAPPLDPTVRTWAAGERSSWMRINIEPCISFTVVTILAALPRLRTRASSPAMGADPLCSADGERRTLHAVAAPLQARALGCVATHPLRPRSLPTPTTESGLCRGSLQTGTPARRGGILEG
jgi:hypothetical protein